MALKEAYEFMREKGMLVFEYNEHRTKIKDTEDQIKYGKINIRYRSDEIIEDLKHAITVSGENEVVWVYFGNHKGVYMPMEFDIPKFNNRAEGSANGNPYIETTLKYALRIFEIVGEKGVN